MTARDLIYLFFVRKKKEILKIPVAINPVEDKRGPRIEDGVAFMQQPL